MIQSLPHVAEIETSGSGPTTTFPMTFNAKPSYRGMKMMSRASFGSITTLSHLPATTIQSDFGLKKMEILSHFRSLKATHQQFGVWHSTKRIQFFIPAERIVR